jgi:hypothetical protein
MIAAQLCSSNVAIRYRTVQAIMLVNHQYNAHRGVCQNFGSNLHRYLRIDQRASPIVFHLHVKA